MICSHQTSIHLSVQVHFSKKYWPGLHPVVISAGLCMNKKLLLPNIKRNRSLFQMIFIISPIKHKLYDSVDEYLGIGIAEHIKNIRIKEARRLLKETNLAVHEIADKIGFNDYNYFCRVFKKEVGMPAKQYRKQDGVI